MRSQHKCSHFPGFGLHGVSSAYLTHTGAKTIGQTWITLSSTRSNGRYVPLLFACASIRIKVRRKMISPTTKSEDTRKDAENQAKASQSKLEVCCRKRFGCGPV